MRDKAANRIRYQLVSWYHTV